MHSNPDHYKKFQETAFRNYLDLIPKPFGTIGIIWVWVLAIILVIGGFYYIKQLREGLVITGLGNYTSWGIYISNFVFFVAISLVGSLVSAILKLTDIKWRTPLTRISEVIAVGAIIFAGIVIIIDMGRPDRFWHLIVYGRLQSPITWDVIVITTYLFISLLLLYIPMIPDLALLRDHGDELPAWQRKLYGVLSLNWKGDARQANLLHRSVNALAIVIIPVAFAIHTVTSWLFATTLRPGWDSTNFGPYFVSGAFMVGAAGVIAFMFILRKFKGLDRYFTDRHFNLMGKLLVLLSLVYLYFNINEYFVPAYKMKAAEAEHLHALFTGEYAPLFWAVQFFGMILPIIVLVFPKGRRPWPLFIMSLLVIIGAWFKRFLIVIPTLAHPYIPMDRVREEWQHYVPTMEEWFITAGTLAGALLVITLIVRYFPIVPIIESAEEAEEKN